MEPSEIIIGHRKGWGTDIPFALDSAARRQHAYVIGQTGAGKSTLLRNLILQDIEAGRGVALLDPHGDLALEILDQIPPYRTSDVIYFSPGEPDPLGINLFRATRDEWHIVASGVVSAFKKFWGDSWGPRLEYVLYAAVAALAQCENTSLLGISRMLFDDAYRGWVVKQVYDPMVRSFWLNEFNTYDKRFRQEVIGPIQNKVGQIFLAPGLRNVLGQVRSKINFRSIMDGRKVFIANLSKGLTGESHSDLLGSLLVTGFEMAAHSRADSPVDKRPEFFFYADEFYHFATDSFASILSEARKYGLLLTLAHQYLGQLSDEVAAAIFGNVGTLISFRVGESDGAILERQFGSTFTRSQFTGLENFEMCVRPLNQEPFMAKSLPPLDTGRRRAKIVIEESKSHYSTKQQLVEEKIEKWLKRRH